MSFRLLTMGPPRLLDSGSGAPVDLPLGKPFALLVYLAVEAAPVSRDDLAVLFWPGVARERARQSVRQALWLLRRTLGAEAFASDDPVALAPGAVVADVVEFGETLAGGDVAAAERLWGGPFLERFALSGAREWQRWVEGKRDSAANAFAEALRASAAVEREAGHLTLAVALLRRAALVAGYRVAVRGDLIDALLDARELEAAGTAIAEARRDFGTEAHGIDFERFEQRLAAARAGSDRCRRGPELSTDFVGRAAELADLLGLWTRARAGHTSAILISGPTGIGKSRLAAEVGEAVEGTVVSVKASEAEREIEYGLVATLVRHLLRLRGAAGVSGASDGVLRALVPSLATGNHGDGGAKPVDGDAAHPITPVPIVALADALADLFGAVSEEAPLLVILDDAQWLDAQSRVVLASLRRRLHDTPCLFIATARPGDASPEFAMLLRALEQERVVTRYELGPLRPADVSELLVLMAEFPDTANAERIASRLHAVTGGNPLFLIELVRALHDDGVVEFGSGRWIFHADRLPDELELPASVRAVVDRRLDRLSPDAAALAGHLARMPRGGSLATLRQRVRLEEGAFTRATGELVDRDVARVVDDERLEFTHDQLREGAIRRFPVAVAPAADAPVRRVRRPRRALLGVALALVVATAAFFGFRTTSAGAGLYGGGMLYVAAGDSILALSAHAGRRDWEVHAAAFRAPVPIDAGRLTGPYLGPQGGRYWLGHEQSPPAPPRILRYDGLGPARVVASDSGDATAGYPSPDGRHFLWLRDDPTTDDYDYQLMISNADGSDPRALGPSGSNIGMGSWAPDGHAIAAATYGTAEDQVVILSPAGSIERVIAMPGKQGSPPEWCRPDRIVASAMVDGAPVLLMVDPATGTVRPSAAPPPEGPITCSPDGSAIAYRGILNERLRMISLDLQSGEARAIPVDADVRLLSWLPATPPVVPENIRIADPPAAIAWGVEARLSATVRMSDGHPRKVPLRWETTDSLTATIDDDGQLTANRPGRVRVIATTPSWLADTIEIEVLRGEGIEDLAFQDFGPDFVAFDTTKWILIGDSPPPVGVKLDGMPAVEFFGNGQYADGVLLRIPRQFPRGLTADVEFRLPLERWDRESFNLCVQDPERVPGTDGRNPSNWTDRQKVCFGYPASGMAESDSSRASLGEANGVVRTVSVAPDLPGNRWALISLQIRPNGEVDYYLNGRHLLRGPVRIPDVGTRAWRITLSVATVDTHLYVRNLTVWEGTKY